MRIYTLIALFISLSSFCQEKREIPKKILEEVKIMLEKDQKNRTLLAENKNDFSKKEIDSIWRLQKTIDCKNVLRLIQIVEKYGYFHSGNSNSKEAIFAIFMHSPNKLKKKVSTLIENEKKQNRIDKGSYSLIKWHLEGRSVKDLKINIENK
ncbi:hypothetical protein MK851_11780 [Tenacibaculum sp. 1B UA]|uniref:hypothetical protein n=1 Tax=Tenacibaculum sp. 1B UA TaxID=2922252 RepID=UPI002A23C901|nr:hypothetical protein [Tenacibaculum sp. 1B UA]MDX8554300.1 hypothetical protein [Tenacibaculum sp. 1B UA]